MRAGARAELLALLIEVRVFPKCIPFEHQSLSVFRNFAEFHAINPLVKAPTLVLD